ncbi:MAG: hypothetical protein CL558_12245 [Alphaproteobacteria bacterium]|nr:hypothetical protein [Alphaproteobacteria bacterium]MAS46284.1 hypothetical protein [Alphaproteobacteria bacterium]MAX95530.1 hypothetical protein [Alphaproteobacteria bacterium]MBN54331.1 hypothetical protein [Alphaproteobacteria bacterium]OUT42104.1 MAG: hypothetical protein CBB62_07335 [Micavibrio sp. TMED2]|tara:strand:- start:20989 stop:22071 length:1083 start_codon:yes stop_codon:yes gene_type:complete
MKNKPNFVLNGIVLGVASVALVAPFEVRAQQAGSQFAPDPSVFEQLTDMQRQISLLEREVLLEDLKLRRRELDIQMQALEREATDRELERERLQRVEREESEKERLEIERQEAIRRAEEDLRISELRAEREAILRSIEIASEEEEAAARAAMEPDPEPESEDDEDGVRVVPSNQVQRVSRLESSQQQNLIVTPSAQAASSTIPAAQPGSNFETDLGALADMLGVPTPQPIQAPAEIEVEAEPEPEPEPIAPVVRKLKGVNGLLTATLVIDGGGVVDVTEGDRIPGDWKIVSIVPGTVMARHKDADEDTRLAFGTRVAMAAGAAPMMSMQPQEVVPTGPSLSGGFNPIGTSPLPVPTFSGF